MEYDLNESIISNIFYRLVAIGQFFVAIKCCRGGGADLVAALNMTFGGYLYKGAANSGGSGFNDQSAVYRNRI